jgi:hypothetical protein
MCVPEISIRPDGKGFVVRRGGIDWNIDHLGKWWAVSEDGSLSCGDTIMEAVDNAIAKVRAASPQGDKK